MHALVNSNELVYEMHGIELEVLDEIPMISEHDYCYALNELHCEEELDRIPVVKDFPQVFPKDLPGIPPLKEIEFEIKMQPGASLISILHYKMPITNMNKLKKQLDELFEKGFIRPNVLPWGAHVLFV